MYSHFPKPTEQKYKKNLLTLSVGLIAIPLGIPTFLQKSHIPNVSESGRNSST